MECLRISISKKAVYRLNAQSAWYRENCGSAFAMTMLENFEKTVEILRTMPTAGKKHYATEKHQYYAMMAHKKCMVIYRYSQTTLFVTDILFTDTIL